MPQCADCKYYVDGFCERFPPSEHYRPRPFDVSARYVPADYPKVDFSQDACGEYKAGDQ